MTEIERQTDRHRESQTDNKDTRSDRKEEKNKQKKKKTQTGERGGRRNRQTVFSFNFIFIRILRVETSVE